MSKRTLCRACLWRKCFVGGLELCLPCKRALSNQADQQFRESMPEFKTFRDVDRTLPSGMYIRITEMGWHNGVYQIKNGGNNAQGHVWGTYVFPGPRKLGGSRRGSVPYPLRRWGDELPPAYESAADDPDDDV